MNYAVRIERKPGHRHHRWLGHYLTPKYFTDRELRDFGMYCPAYRFVPTPGNMRGGTMETFLRKNQYLVLYGARKVKKQGFEELINYIADEVYGHK